MAFPAPLLQEIRGLCLPSVFVTPASMRVMGSTLRRATMHGVRGQREGGGGMLRDHRTLHAKKKSGPETGKLKGQWSDQEGNYTS